MTQVRKLSAGVIGGAVATLIVWLLPLTPAPTITPEAAAAIGALCVWVASALIPDAKEE